MSIHVLSWVLKSSPTRLADRLVLIVLADHASEDGAGAYPSVKTISDESRLSRRAVQDSLRRLEDTDAITRTGDSEWGTAIYRVEMLTNEERKLCAGANGSNSALPFSENTLPNAPKPSFEPSFEPSKEEETPSLADAVEKDFKEFYAAFPLRRKPLEALAKYRAARKKGATHAEIMAGIPPYVADVEAQRKGGFAELKWQAPASWLYQGRWMDEYGAAAEYVDPRKAGIEKYRRTLSGDERARRKAAGEHPYDRDTQILMGESPE